MKREVVVAALTTAATVVAVAAILRYWKKKGEKQWKQTRSILRQLARECTTPASNLWMVADALVSDIEKTLSAQETTTEAAITTTTLKGLNSIVTLLPTGDEEGLFYGVNLRGTNFLILRARLGGKNECISDLRREEIEVPSNVMAGTSQELFDYIAAELSSFVSKHNENSKDATTKTKKKLGFTISYPVDQTIMSSGTAIKWKSLAKDDPVGKELVNDMNQALKKHGVDMQVLAMVDETVVDETVGDLAGGRYYNKDSVAAITLGMSTNAAYVESAQSAMIRHGRSAESGDMVINMDWGNFNSSNLPITEFDATLDAESSNPGHRIFEKLVSGMYLGEIVRRVLLKLAQETGLFGDNVPPKLTIPYLLESPDMAAIHQDTSEDHEVVAEKLKDIFGILYTTPMVREIIVEVCDIVAERGARLAGAGIVGIIKKLGRIENKRSVVTIEGGLFEHYRVFRNYLNSSVWEMLGNEFSDNVVIEHSHGGSGAGAVFLAASHSQSAES